MGILTRAFGIGKAAPKSEQNALARLTAKYGPLVNAGMNGLFFASELAGGNSIGGALGSMAGWNVGSSIGRGLGKALTGGKGVLGAAAGLAGSIGGGLYGSSAGSDLANKIAPIKRLNDNNGTTPSNVFRKGAEENCMNKFAMLKEAEVGGVLAAFVDSGLMQKLAEDDFALLTEKVAENLGDSYTVEDVAYVTDQLLSGAGMSKSAEETVIDELAPVFGYAYMAKMAGEIDDADLDAFAEQYLASL